MVSLPVTYGFSVLSKRHYYEDTRDYAGIISHVINGDTVSGYLETGECTEVNAGHEHPAIRRKGGIYELNRYKHSPALAALEGMTFVERRFRLDPGDSLFVYTDGITEATNSDMKLFGEERLVVALNKNSEAGPEEILKNVKDSIDGFVGDTPKFDDITMLAFRYNGK